ncbi:MAG: hypothetical protein K2P92_01000, partial [Bdellovibrionaceae bacterium]|nr:hypothetical protein [Pseudobdellovibrionaceae bacterium]
RILLLTNLCNEHRKKHSSQDVLNYLQSEIAKLDRITQKILTRLNNEENLMAENTTAFQVNNELAAPSRVSTVMNRYRFSIEQTPGVTVEGQSLKIDSQIVNLRQSDDDFKNDHDDEKGSCKSADFILNGQYLFTSAPKKMLPGTTISYSYQTALAPSNIYYATWALFDIENGRRKNRFGSLTKSILVLDDQVAPAWQTESVPGLNKAYVQNMPLINAIVADSFGRINPNVFTANLIGTTTQNILPQLTITKLGDGEAYNLTGNLNPLSEGDYVIELSARDLGGRFATPNPYRAEFAIDRTAPVTSVDLQDNQVTRLTSLQLPASVTDMSPVTTKIYVNDMLQFSTEQKNFTANLNLNIEGENKVTVISTDAAGNVSSHLSKSVFRDTTAPVLSSLLPAQNSKIFQYQFLVSGV